MKSLCTERFFPLGFCQAKDKLSHLKKAKKLKICIKGKVAQSCLTLCNPMDYTVNGILQARRLEWDSFSGGSSQPRDQTQVSCIAGGFFTS